MGIKSDFDKPDQIDKYIKMLGNLTLLEKPINASIQDKPFQIKKNAYPKSKFLITKSIGEKVNIGSNTSIDRAVQDLEPFDNWNSESIEMRQDILAQLATKI
ncbi:MAG: HNH endonuclease family protein [Sphaerospermopsis kisseleviana]